MPKSFFKHSLSKRSRFLLSATAIATISPIIPLVVSCSSSDSDSKKIEIKKDLKANDLGLVGSNTSNIELINSQWILNNKEKIFTGQLDLLNEANQINVVQVVGLDNKLEIAFYLAAGSTYDSSGEVSNVPVFFIIEITNFSTVLSFINQSIVASAEIGLDPTKTASQNFITTDWIFEYRQKLFSQNTVSLLTNVNQIQFSGVNNGIEIGPDGTTLKLTISFENQTPISILITGFQANQPTALAQNLTAASFTSLANKTVEQALSLIDGNWIFANLNVLFQSGTNLINKQSIQEISVIQDPENNTNLILNFTLSAGSIYDLNGSITTVATQFSLKITNFAQPLLFSSSTIDANQVNLDPLQSANQIIISNQINAQWIIENKSSLFSNPDLLTEVSQISSINLIPSLNGTSIVLSLSYNLQPQISITINNLALNQETKAKTDLTSQIFSNIGDNLEHLDVAHVIDILFSADSIEESKQWIIDNKTSLFTGGIDLLTQPSQILTLEAQQSSDVNTTLVITIQLAAGSVYNQNHEPSTSPTQFTTSITGFSRPLAFANSSFQATQLSLSTSQSATEVSVSNLITPSWIFTNKNVLFDGQDLLNYIDQSLITIDSVTPSPTGDVLNLTISYNGQSPITTSITGFSKNQQTAVASGLTSALFADLGSSPTTGQVIENMFLNNIDFTKQWIIDHKAVLFTGGLNLLNNTNQIIAISASQKPSDPTTLVISLELAAGSVYNENFVASTENKSFSIEVADFESGLSFISSTIEAQTLSLEQSQTANQIIDSDIITKNWIVTNKALLFANANSFSNLQESDIEIDSIVANENGTSLTLTISYQSQAAISVVITGFSQNQPTISMINLTSSTFSSKSLETATVGKVINQMFIHNINDTKQWIIENKQDLFSGGVDLLTSINQVLSVSAIESPTDKSTLLMTIELAAGSVYDQNNLVSTTPTKFVITFTGFSLPILFINQVFNASSLNLNSTLSSNQVKESSIINEEWIISNKTALFSDPNLVPEQSSSTINIVLTPNTSGTELVLTITFENQLSISSKIVGFTEHLQTVAKTDLVASLFSGFDSQTVTTAADLINQQWIFDNLSNLFTGDISQINLEDITSISAAASDEDENTLEIKFTLAEGSIYDVNHLLNSTSQEITISISGFSSSSPGTF